jgi:L-asparaginase
MIDKASQHGERSTLQIRSMNKASRDFAVVFHSDPRDQVKLLENRVKLGLADENKGVLVIYTGGTIGSAPKDPEDPRSPQVVKPWPELAEAVPALSLTSPQSISFRIDAVAFEDPLDSSNMGPMEWNAVAKLLKKYMDEYEGFVIAHGTDTMVYSASALSFMLVNLKKPVILTGSQLSAIGHVRNDAQQNLITAILIANARYSQIPNVPEVCIFFRDKLLRGNRSIKVDATGYVAYKTHNFPELGAAGATISINEDLILKPNEKDFDVHERIDTNVINLSVFPGIQDREMLKSILSMPDLKAVVLRTFGAGNTATSPGFLRQLEVARERGIVIINVTQCSQGSVQMGLYETSAVLMKYGVISGIDITAEAALAKLMVLLGDERLEPGEVPRRAQENLRGEQSESIFVTPMKQGGVVTLSRRSPAHWFLTEEKIRPVEKGVRHAVLILHSATVRPEAGQDRLEVNIFINVSKDDDLIPRHPKKACSVSRLRVEEGTLVFDVTEAVKHHLDPHERNSFTVQLGGVGEGELVWTSGELALYVEA